MKKTELVKSCLKIIKKEKTVQFYEEYNYQYVIWRDGVAISFNFMQDFVHIYVKTADYELRKEVHNYSTISESKIIDMIEKMTKIVKELQNDSSRIR